MDKIKAYWESVKAWFKNSTTILYARLQVVAGVIVAAVQGVDWASLYTSITHLDWANLKGSTISAAVLIFNGIVTEILRRRTA